MEGRCPSCGNETLFLGVGGHVTCSWHECKQPEAATEALAVVPEMREQGHHESGIAGLCVEMGEAVGRLMDETLAERRPEIEQVVLAVLYRDDQGEGRVWKSLDATRVSALRGLLGFVSDTVSGRVAS